jgi:hypothetical protein
MRRYFGILGLVLAVECGGADSGASTGPSANVARVEITPAVLALTPGQTVQMSAVAYDASSGAVTSPGIHWAVSGDPVATVTASGLVTATAPGTFSVSAVAGTVSRSAPGRVYLTGAYTLRTANGIAVPATVTTTAPCIGAASTGRYVVSSGTLTFNRNAVALNLSSYVDCGAHGYGSDGFSPGVTYTVAGTTLSFISPSGTVSSPSSMVSHDTISIPWVEGDGATARLVFTR